MAAPLVPLAVALLMGTLLKLQVSVPLLAAWGLATACAWTAWQRRRRGRWALPALYIFWVCLGILRAGVWQAHAEHSIRSLLTDTPTRVALHGVVAEDPIDWLDQPEVSGQTCVLEIRHVRLNPSADVGWVAVRGRARMHLLDPKVPLRYADEVLLDGEWQRPPSPGNHGEYDWRSALARQRIDAVVRVKPFNGLVCLGRGPGRPWLSWAYGLRGRWDRLIRDSFNRRDAGLLLPLLLGERATLEERIREAFVQTGTMHLLVISGSHVAVVALLLGWLVRLLGMPWRIQLVGTAVGLGAYCLIVGMTPPVVRATVMGWALLGALALDRIINWANTLALAALAIVWVNPTQALDPGFQLSFGAVLSLLLFCGRWAAWLESRLPWIRSGRARRYLATSLGSTAAVWVGLWPMLAWYFYLVSPVSVLANLLVVPLVAAIVVCGTGGLAAGSFVPGLLLVVRPALAWLLQALVACVTWCQRLPGGFWYLGRPAWWLLAGYYVLLAGSLLARRLGWSRRRLLACWLLGLVGWGVTAAVMRVAEVGWLTVEVLDVGHGDSLLIQTPTGRRWLVDAGTEEAGRHRVVPRLRWAGINSLEALIITHPDADHAGGAVPVLEAVQVKRLLTNGARDDTMTSRRLDTVAARRRVARGVLRRGMALGDGRSVRLDVLHPPAGFVGGVPPASNDNSVVLKLTMGAISILLTGDLEEAGVPTLLAQREALAATVLKVPHHGSALGREGERFFAAVHPQWALISVGTRPGLPATATLEALRRVRARVLMTHRDGAIRVRTDGRRLELTTVKGSP